MLRAPFWLSSVTALAVVGLCTGGVLVSQRDGAGPGSPTLRSGSNPGADSSPAEAGTGDLPARSADSATPALSEYRNGEYSATGSYLTPGGDESIGVTLVVAAGLVVDAAVRTEALSPTARQFQVQFQSDIVPAVVGRELKGLSISRVAGASLTSIGFNDAISSIQAKAGPGS